MSDQGEKIIHLAREVLRSGRLCDDPNDGYDGSRSLSLKAAALAALLAAVGGAGLTHIISEMQRPINRVEKVELDALIFYAARQNATTEDSIRHDMQMTLQLRDMNDLSVHDYRSIREYLWQRIP